MSKLGQRASEEKLSRARRSDLASSKAHRRHSNVIIHFSSTLPKSVENSRINIHPSQIQSKQKTRGKSLEFDIG